jgi:hypothetical protein
MVETNWLNKGQQLSGTQQFNNNNNPLINDSSTLLKTTPTTTTVTNMQPVLEKVEKIVHKDVFERDHITEQHQKEVIEIHEQPIQKRVLHPEQQLHIQEQSIYETSGDDNLLERERLLERMRQEDQNRGVIVNEREDLVLHNQAPTVQVQNEYRREIIEKPIVTEVHEQPITEVHERDIFKTIHEAPSVTVVRDAPIIESDSYSSQPLLGTVSSGSTYLHQQQPLIQQQTFVQQQPLIQQQTFVQQQPSVGTTLIEKGLGDPVPHVTNNTGINPLSGTRKL